MGLLDEAIREHLELKRRRGGDPTEIAREEREALDPAFPAAAGPADGTPLDGELADAVDQAPVGGSQAPAGGGPAPEPAAASGEDFSSVGEETAELDMQAVLGADEMLTEEHHAAPVGAEDEQFDREAPRGAGHGPPELDPGQERLSFE